MQNGQNVVMTAICTAICADMSKSTQHSCTSLQETSLLLQQLHLGQAPLTKHTHIGHLLTTIQMLPMTTMPEDRVRDQWQNGSSRTSRRRPGALHITTMLPLLPLLLVTEPSTSVHSLALCKTDQALLIARSRSISKTSRASLSRTTEERKSVVQLLRTSISRLQGFSPPL